MQTPEQDKKRRQEFNRQGSGRWHKSTPYEDTECRTDLLKTRGYVQDEDGTWVP